MKIPAQPLDPQTFSLPPGLPGSYALCLRLAHPERLAAGKLGEFDFPAGDYVYLGRAHGPGGLRSRLERHGRGAVRRHWHIDFLRAAAAVTGAVVAVESATCDRAAIPLECTWSQLLAGLPGASIPAAHFGSSDCRCGCPAHLVHFEVMLVERLAEALGRATAGVRCEIIYLDGFGNDRPNR